jgi:hypothetical protein
MKALLGYTVVSNKDLKDTNSVSRDYIVTLKICPSEVQAKASWLDNNMVTVDNTWTESKVNEHFAFLHKGMNVKLIKIYAEVVENIHA